MSNYLKLRSKLGAAFIFAFLLNSIGPFPVAEANDFRLPAPGGMVHLSLPFNPPILKGLKIHPDDPFRFDFILDKGDGYLDTSQLKDESTRLIRYFLASLTTPDKDLWVNLSPYEKNRIIPHSFGMTEMGRDLLAEDYMLKQITASLIYPEDAIGQRFWKQVYEQAEKQFGTTNIPVNTFNKVWILPEKAVVYENAKAGTAYVVESKLKVMLEEDYLSLQKHEGIENSPAGGPDYNRVLTQQSEPINALGSQIVREIVIPQLTREVNENRNFMALRQVYNSLILAAWYKRKLKESILGQVYANRNKVAGVTIDDPQETERIYQRYLQAFKKGVYNYIREEIDPATHQAIPRKYFSGGVQLDLAMRSDKVIKYTSQMPANRDGFTEVSAVVKPFEQDVSGDISSKIKDHATTSDIFEIHKDILYPDAAVDPNSPDKNAPTFFANFPSDVTPQYTYWEKRIARPFTSSEQAIFDTPDFPFENLSLIPRDHIKTIQYTSYMRSKGTIRINVIITDQDGGKHYGILDGRDSTVVVSWLNTVRASFPELKYPHALAQISAGNQADILGNFTVLSRDGQWHFFGAVNEYWRGKIYRALVQLKDGRRKLGFIRLNGNDDNDIQAVQFQEGVENTGEFKRLSADNARFVFVACALGWGDDDPEELLRAYYTKEADVRHVTRFPLGYLFMDQVTEDSEKFKASQENRPIVLDMKALDHEQTIGILNKHGYTLRNNFQDVTKAGDYCIEAEKIKIIFLSARYPINTLVVGANGHLASVAIGGASGQKGANYWTVRNWIYQKIEGLYGWKPLAIFVLDNGMEPRIRTYDALGEITDEWAMPGTRKGYTATISIFPVTADQVMSLENILDNKSNAPKERSRAAIELAKLAKGEVRIAQKLIGIIDAPNVNEYPLVKEGAIKGLSYMGETAKIAVPSLFRLLRDEDSYNAPRRRSIETLLDLGIHNKEMVEVLVQILNNPFDFHLWQTAQRGLLTIERSTKDSDIKKSIHAVLGGVILQGQENGAFIFINSRMAHSRTIRSRRLPQALENYRNAIAYFLNQAPRSARPDLNTLIALNKIIMRGLPLGWKKDSEKYGIEWGGLVRGSRDLSVEGFPGKYLPSSEVQGKIEDFFKWYESNYDSMDTFLFAAEVYKRLTQIHVFWDGNGRTVRLFVDWILLDKGYLLEGYSKNYFDALTLSVGDISQEIRLKAKKMVPDDLKILRAKIINQNEENIKQAPDGAMVNPKGGVDLTPANLQLQIQNRSGKIRFHMDPAMLEQLQNASGFVPVVTSIEPVGDLRGFLTGVR